MQANQLRRLGRVAEHLHTGAAPLDGDASTLLRRCTADSTLAIAAAAAAGEAAQAEGRWSEARRQLDREG